VIGEISPDTISWSGNFKSLVDKVKSLDIDLAFNFNLHPDVPHAYLVYLSGAALRVGMYREGYPKAYNVEIIPSENVIYETERYNSMILALGITTVDEQMDWILSKRSTEDIRKELRRLGVKGNEKLVAIDCTSGVGKSSVPTSLVSGLAGELATRFGAKPIVFTDPDSSLADEELDTVTLTHAAGLLANCRALITTNTALYHLAVALGIPCIAIFEGQDSRRWILENYKPLEKITVDRLEDVSVEEITGAVERLLAKIPD